MKITTVAVAKEMFLVSILGEKLFWSFSKVPQTATNLNF